MKPISLPTFSKLNQALAKATTKLHPSQVHGVICGIICGKPESESGFREWIKGHEKGKTIRELLDALYQASKQQLSDFLFEFQLILPADSANLSARAEALTLWCQGFLTGLKMSDVQIEGREPGEVTEAINDLIEISKMNYEEVVESEEDETAFVELVEYLRVAVILIYQSLREATESPSKNTFHNHVH